MAHAIALAVTSEAESNRTYNVADENTPTYADFLRELGVEAEWLGQVVPVPPGQLPEDLTVLYRSEQHWTTDTARIRFELGYSELVDRPEALFRTIKWDRTVLSRLAPVTHHK